MPTPPKSTDNMRKHLTNSERESRRAVEAGQRRKVRISMHMPKWLSPEAQQVWKDVRRKLKGIDLLDNTDAEMLAVYCDAYAQYKAASAILTKARVDHSVASKDDIAACQSWARLIGSLGEKLGLTPQGKARLARRKAKDEEPDELERLLDDVTGFVNGDQ